MAKCAYCASETELYNNKVPVCVQCSEGQEGKRKGVNSDQIRTALVGMIAQATARLSDANLKFNEAINRLPSGLPHPDGAQQIKNASSELASARKEIMAAHRRLNDFVERGTIPDDVT